MKATKLENEGKITAAERVAVSNTSGHCLSNTVRNHYLYEDRVRDAQAGNRMFPESENVDYTLALDSYRYGYIYFFYIVRLTCNVSCNYSMCRVIRYEAIEWGRLHPSFAKKSENVFRVPWSSAELSYMNTVITRLKRVQGPNPKRLHSQILKAIQNDPDAYPIFHEHHVVNTTRIRGGCDNLSKKMDD